MESKLLPVEKGVEIEIQRHYSGENHPGLVFAKGLGGSAGRDLLVDSLADKFDVTTFSPRGSGSSLGGELTIDNLLGDLSKVLDNVAQRKGDLPCVIGHSMNGYALSHILSDEKKTVSRAVLLSPLISMQEQIPAFITPFLKSALKHKKAIFGFLNGFPFYLDNIRLGTQAFNLKGNSPFLESIFNARVSNEKLKVPTYVNLSGRTCFGLPINNLLELKNSWQNLGAAVVETYPQVNHLYSTSLYSGDKFYNIAGKFGIADKVKRFLLS